jgi:transcriptional regulator with XRE-family HTH domain
MLPVELKTPKEVTTALAGRVRTRRLEREWTQEELAQRAGMTVATFRRFERTGLISLDRLVRIALVLDALPQFEALFRQAPVTTLAELEKQRGRRRGKRRDAKT